MESTQCCQFHDNKFYFDQNENTSQSMILREWYCLSFDDFDLIHNFMQMILLNVPYALLKVILVLIRVY